MGSKPDNILLEKDNKSESPGIQEETLSHHFKPNLYRHWVFLSLTE